MRYHYVAIEREYGSGGTEIGKRLAELSHVPCYGVEILREASEELHMDMDEIERYEEKATNSFLYSIYLMGKSGEDGHLSNDGRVRLEEKRVIQAFAEKGPAIFIGRCAVSALEGRDGVLRVFVQADRELRKSRAMESYGISEEDAESVIRKYDKKRSSFYGSNMGRHWKDPTNYHMILDSGELGVDRCARVIWEAMQD